MALREEFEQQGNWLFRWRSYIPLLMIVPLWVAMRSWQPPMQSFRLHQVWEYCCLAVSLLGLGVRVYTIGYAAGGTSGRNTHYQRAGSLNTSGIYSVVRHPLYLGNFLMWLGVAMFALNGWLAIMFALTFWLYYERIMFAEEEFLRGKFGQEFVEWSNRTPAFFPRFSHWQRSDRDFCWRTVLRREYTGLFGIVAGFICLELCEQWVYKRHFWFEPFWAIVGGVTLAAYIVLRLLKKHTRVLHAVGR